MPVLRSLALQCFTNKDTDWRGAEYFFGDHLYVIPIHEPQEGGRFLYIPEGVWYSYHTDSLMAVSYTHLDVYKRQLIFRRRKSPSPGLM